MRTLILALTLVLSGHAATTLIQAKDTTTTGCGAPCNITLPSNMTAGALAVIGSTGSSGAFAISSVVTTGETWVYVSQCTLTSSGPILHGCAYILSAAGGHAGITVNYAGSTFNTHVQYYEFNIGAFTASLDTTNTGTKVDGTFSTSHTGLTLSLATTSIVIQMGAVTSTSPFVSTVSSPYSTNATFSAVSTSYGVGYSYLLDTTTGTAPTWTTTNRPFAGFAIVFTLTPSGGGGGGTHIRHSVKSGDI